MQQAELTKDRDEQLFKFNLKPDLDMKLSVSKWQQLVNKHHMEKQKMDIAKESVDSQLSAQQVQIEKLKAAYAPKKKQESGLTTHGATLCSVQQVHLQA